MLETDAILNAIKERAGSDLPFYSEIYTKSITETPPIFLGKQYEEFFWECAFSIPNWLPRVVAACAVTEGNGAHSLLEIWSRIHDQPTVEAGLLQHAKDEAAHARLFVRLARLAFEENYPPGNLDDVSASLRPIDRKDITKNITSPKISERMVLDYMMQLNIVEIRTRKNLQMMAAMYFNLTPDKNKPDVEKILLGLERDEMTHIAYTASAINELASRGNIGALCRIYSCRMRNYNDHTVEHCDASKHDYGQGNIPMLFAPACGGACKLPKQ